MGIYSINPQTIVNSQNILNIMTQLINDISNSIQSIYNIIIESQYIIMINNINSILNNYLKIYNFFNYGINYIYIQIYNQNINLVVYVVIQLTKPKYINIYSNWSDFLNGTYKNQTKIIYQILTQQQKNELNYAVISGDLYFVTDLGFVYNGINTMGILLKPKNINCDCNKQTNNFEYTYVNTIYWN